MCRDPIDSSKVFIAAAFKPAEEQVEAEEELDLKVENMDFDEKIPPSTKMRTSLELINGWGAADPNDKILIFSQFVAFINALSDYLEENGITNATYTGGMSKDERDETIEAFKKPNGPRVLIISTKAGGVGLNLVCANKVLLIDHGWTYAATAQSIDRAWRIGQTKPVEVIELSVRNTIEARILELQERKKALADGAFGEGGVGKLGRLTLNDLKRLFERDEE
jgi:SNF2 family DNA or RNA helicase